MKLDHRTFSLDPFNFRKIITFLKINILLLVIVVVIASIFLLAWYICKSHTTNEDIISVLKGETEGALLTKQYIRLNKSDVNLLYNLDSLLEDPKYFFKNKVSNIEFLNFPNNFNSLIDNSNISVSKRVFIKMILPLIIKSNKEVLVDREKVLALSKKMPKEYLLDQDIEVFKYLINKYNINLKINTEWDILSGINSLLIKVNYIPNSLVLAAAIRETNWGTSKVLRNYNSLFGEKELYIVSGKNSQNIKNNLSPEFKKFKTLNDSVQSFFENVNGEIDYSSFRNIRYKQLNSKNSINILKLANSLNSSMNQNKSSISLESIILNNNLVMYDKYNDLYMNKKSLCIYFR